MEFSSLKEQIPLRTRRPTLLDVALLDQWAAEAGESMPLEEFLGD
jgi:hypothetical protein